MADSPGPSGSQHGGPIACRAMEAAAAAEAGPEAEAQPQVDAEAEPELAPFSAAVTDAFASHAAHIRARARARQECVRMKSVVHDDEVGEQLTEEDGLGRRQPNDEYQGDCNVRTLKSLLKMVDERGFERRRVDDHAHAPECLWDSHTPPGKRELPCARAAITSLRSTTRS